MKESVKNSGVYKKLDNFWYHYKWHSIIALVAVVTVVVCTVQCAKRDKYDISAVFYMDDVVSDITVKHLENELLKYADDFDGNGDTNIQLANLAYKHDQLESVNTGVANAQLLLSTIVSGDKVLFVVDEYGYNYLMSEDFSLFKTYDFFPDKDGHAWNWKGSSIRASLVDQGINLPENLYFCLRRVENTTAESEKTKQMELNSVKLMQNIIEKEKK